MWETQVFSLEGYKEQTFFNTPKGFHMSLKLTTPSVSNKGVDCRSSVRGQSGRRLDF